MKSTAPASYDYGMKPNVIALGLVSTAAFIGALGLVSPARAAGGAVVDVLLSVGKPESGATCQPDSEGTCDLVKVRLDLRTDAATNVSTVVGHAAMGAPGSGVAEPAVSPNGKRVAWLERGGKGVQLWAKAFTEDRGYLVVKSNKGKDGGTAMRPEWPEWLDDDTLLFSSRTGTSDGKEQKTIFSVELADLTNPGDPVPRAGAGVTGWTGVQDPAVVRVGEQFQMVAFGPVPGGSSEAYQLGLANVDATGRPTSTPTLVEAGKNAEGKAIQGCHHPAWNAAGDRIMCMVHRPSETVGGMATKLLYAYQRDSAGKWALAGRAFEPLTPEAAKLPVASQLNAAAGCQVVSYKYAQYCAGSDDIVTTLYCAKEGKASGRGAEIGASRVVLVRSNPTRYLDVTGMVETAQGLAPGALSSFTGTCRAVD